MKKLIIASTNQGAGKTSFIVGLAKVLGGTTGYLKPLGDRLLYKKKRQWDYDAAVVVDRLGLQESPENMTIGFEHAKLRYMYDEEGIREKLDESIAAVGPCDRLFLEAGKTLTYGISLRLDALSLAKTIDGTLIALVSGDENSIIDDITFAKGFVDYAGVNLGGVVINKVRDKKDFLDTHEASIKDLGVKILGVVPFEKELTYVAAGYVADKLFAKVIAGEAALGRMIKHIVVGAMSANAALAAPVFSAEDKLVITSGDRADMLLAAIETNSAAVVLTHNILPPANLIAMAAEKGIPLMLVKPDTFAVAKQIDDMEPLMTVGDAARADFLARLVKEHIDLSAL